MNDNDTNSSNKHPLEYRVALAAALLAIDLLIVVFGDVQRGPDWEIPVRVMGNFVKASMLSPLLCVVAAVLYIRAKGFASLAARAKRGLQIVLAVAGAISAVAWLADPTQWRHRAPLLAKLVSVAPFATIVISSIVFWYLGFRLLNSRLRSGFRAVGLVVAYVVVVMALVILLIV